MTLAGLIATLPPTGLDGLAFPRHLIGAFRRKSISFCTGMTDETTIVYWFQSKTFSVDLRLPDGSGTPVAERQGWIGDTQWDADTRLLSWHIERSYQPRNQWPEPAALSFIGNSVLEFAPSGAYIEDWRQQSCRGPYLGLRLVAMLDPVDGTRTPVDGGLVIAGEHTAFARSRLPAIDDALLRTLSIENALATGVATEAEVESYEVSVAVGGSAVTHSTQPGRVGEAIVAGEFSVQANGMVSHETLVGGEACVLLYRVDVFEPDFSFDLRTPSTPQAADWMDREKRHLFHHAVFVR